MVCHIKYVVYESQQVKYDQVQEYLPLECDNTVNPDLVHGICKIHEQNHQQQGK